MKVDFFIVGAQKAGTTFLDYILRKHPRIQMASCKEVHYFDNDLLDWDEPDVSYLHKHYDWRAEGLLRGEATPIYIYWPNALERLHSYNPNAKIIVGLRQPSFRAYSHWRMERQRGAELLSFEEATGTVGRERVLQEPNGHHRVFSYVERGFYAEQISRIVSIMSRSNVHVFRTDRMWNQAEQVISDIHRFLSVGAQNIAHTPYISPVGGSKDDSITPDARAALDEMFRRDIHRTSALTGLDLSDWLEREYREPMIAIAGLFNAL